MKQGKLLITFLLLFAGILNSYAQPRFSYEIFNGRVFFDNREIVYADYYTFVDLGYGYAKDRNHVFMNGRILPYVDPYSFNVSPRYAPEEEYPDFEADYGLRHPGYEGYRVLGGQVLYAGQIVPDASSSSFHDLGQAYAKDAFNVFFRGRKIEDASASSFVVLKYGYSKDAFNAYYYGRKIEGAGINFKVLDDGYAEDGFNVWYRGRKIESGTNIFLR